MEQKLYRYTNTQLSTACLSSNVLVVIRQRSLIKNLCLSIGVRSSIILERFSISGTVFTFCTNN